MAAVHGDPRSAARVARAGAAGSREGGLQGDSGLLIFESAWEVCAQTGGIYTVLRSKAPVSVEDHGENYWLIGPYHEAGAKIEFEPQPPQGVVAEAVEELRRRGVTIYCGRWLVTGRPRTILIDHRSLADKLHELKYFLWKDVGIGTPGNDPETDNYVLFGYACADLLAEIHKNAEQPILAHFHEWQSAIPIPLLKQRGHDFPTLFTTHATLVGRHLSAANEELYERLPEFDPAQVATEHGVAHRYQIERAAAQACDIFTTVSEITAHEAEYFLGRQPDAVLPNALNVERFAAAHEFQVLHQQNKERIHEFVRGHFFPSYSFDLERTLYLFTAGRYEYRNKGIDVFIDALAELNRRLRADSNGMTVVAFIVTRVPYRGYNNDTLNRQAMFNELQDTCHAIKEDMGRGLAQCVAEGRLPTIEDLLDEYARVRLKRMMHAWWSGDLPTIVTHDLQDDVHDPTLRHLRRVNLVNGPEDPVKVIFHPEFITPTSPVIGMEYDQFVRGCNLGVFPSYYEPWGYTPMECAVRGVPSITSDLSGFGAYLQEHFPEHDAHGLYVARRRRADYETTIYQVAGWLHQLTQMSLRDRINLRNAVESHAEHFDWHHMSRYYRAARYAALDRFDVAVRPGD